ncbi:transmembrane protein 186 [Entelurus aequoreus]|uniref:transmembrane protein 186-like n=1 Tax=Entelurus aequoreus TaxID=161455 RepID=UPI002B1D8B36|nr:transmembrane protein 186-like [Entelurus aequoreus]XP_061889369.1 transmembrane protein 186 [Entelurus aequoreus]
MICSALAGRLRSHILSCIRGSCKLTNGHLSCNVVPHSSRLLPLHHGCQEPFDPKTTAHKRYSDFSTQKFDVFYKFPHMKLCRAISRIKLLQTGITVVILPPVYILYFMGDASLFLVNYSTGVAVFAGVMLYTASHFLRRVVGMMYLDSSKTTLRVSHLTFWGQRHDIYIPVSDVKTLGDTGDSLKESILKLKRYSTPQTFYFSTHFGRVVDKLQFEKVFGKVK